MICVECGLKLASESLYVEYSERNIKLMRCESCLQVADKYIEYELLLVSIDLILLREQAYRHILFNRSLLNRASIGMIPSLMVSVLLVNLLLKMVVVEQGGGLGGEGEGEGNRGGVEGNSFFYPLYLLAAALAEHLLFVGTVMVMLRQSWQWQGWFPCVPSSSLSSSSSSSSPSSSSSTPLSTEATVNTSISSPNLAITKHFYRKIYIALTFPEMAKLVTLLLKTWDSSPVLFFVAGGLCLAFQYTSLCAALSYFQQRRISGSGCATVFAMAVLVKVAVRLFFHSPLELVMLGIIV